MHRADFRYHLPPELIAQHPPVERGESRLLRLCGCSGKLQDREFSSLPTLLRPGDLLVLNNTSVIPARLFGNKTSGGRVEILLERILSRSQALVQIKASKAPQVDSMLHFKDSIQAQVLSRQEDMFVLDFSCGRNVLDIFRAFGSMPLPPYIKRRDNADDRKRYQTVYANVPGAVAAPTAGLHFTDTMLEKLARQNIKLAYITLHVGAGTFQPVRTECVEAHKIHSEYLEVSDAVCDKISTTQANGCRVIAVGTTVVRALETASQHGHLQSFRGESDIFIYPGYHFQVVDALLTNFHLSESTLLMLVCAFAGRDHVLSAYQHAIRQKYRFYSYGDAMFITGRDLSITY